MTDIVAESLANVKKICLKTREECHILSDRTDISIILFKVISFLTNKCFNEAMISWFCNTGGTYGY